ncbi:MAG: BtrH N-terminal domain-containing protein [Pseudomonadales bacterium]
MRQMIENFRIVPAGHCGSGAMRNLIYHYCDLDLEEGVVFGLGAGLDTIFFSYEAADPPFMFFGRGASMEADLARTMGLDYEEQIQLDDDLAWEEVKQEILQGRPTMLSGDILYLDYREYKVHFPAHRFVLLGFDEEKEEVYIADRINTYPETCSMGALRKSRNPPEAISTYNQWGKFSSGVMRHSLPQACGIALRITVERMLGVDRSQRDLMAAMAGGASICASGLSGLQTFQQQMRLWPDLANAASYAQYVDNVIIKFGTGGGFFRNHYAVFMAWARELRPDLVSADSLVLARQAADQWNALSQIMQTIVASPGDKTLWAQAADQVEDIYVTEYTMFGQLGDTVL